MDKFAFDGRRSSKIRRNHGILPSATTLRNLRVVIIVTLLYYLIIKRMIKHLHPHLLECVEILLTGRQESDIMIRGAQFHRPGLGRIQRSESLGDIVQGIRVFKPLAQNYHSVRYVFKLIGIRDIILERIVCARKQAQ